MTRPRPIQMNPNRLPPLTDAQAKRASQIRKVVGTRGKVTVNRKGQRKGHIVISVTLNGHLTRYWFGPDGKHVRTVVERPLFTLEAETPEPSNALMQNTEE